MRKNRWLLLGFLLACIVAVALVVLALLPPRPGITKENFDRIESWMTQENVETILGKPTWKRSYSRSCLMGIDARIRSS